MDAESLIKELKNVGNAEAAIGQQRFFKTYEGGYGEGDSFLGLKVPVIRAIAAPYVQLSLDQISKLLDSPLHEVRFLNRGQSADTYKLAELLLQDTHDLMHKAVGWMLREAGKRVSRDELLAFLDKHAAEMPRTALRYAIEHLSPEQRQYYMRLGKPPKSVL